MSLFDRFDISSDIQRILILGHNGYIGSRLYRTLVDEQLRVKIVGKDFPGVDLTKEKGITDIQKFFGVNTAVIMCSGIKKQHGDTLEIYLKNMKMVMNICKLLEEQPVKRFIYFSSAEVYGPDLHNTNITEETSVQPNSYYGIAKYASECLLRKSIESHDETTLVLLRPTLVYGPGEEGNFYGPSGFVKSVLRGKEITLWGQGEELREFLYIDDLVKIVIRLTFHDYNGILNVVEGKSCTFKAALTSIGQLVSFPIQTSSRPRTRPKVDHVYNNKCFTDLFPDFSFTSLEEGLRNILR